MGNTINKPKPSTDPTQILIELAIILDHPRFRLNFRASLQIPQFLFKREYSFHWIPSRHADETEQENLRQNVQGESRSLVPKSRSVFSDVPLLECTGISSPILEVNSATQNLSFLSEEEDPGSLRSAKNICRVCTDNMKASSLIATVPNAKEFVLNTFKENMVSGVLKCKDICRVQFNNMMCKGDSVTENVKLPTSSCISTVLNAANNSSVNQLERSSVSITVHDKNLRKLIRKRSKIIPFQCRLENYPSGNNNSWEELGEESTSVFSNAPLNQCAESSLPMLEVNSATKAPYFLSEEPLERVYLGSLRSGYSDFSRTSKSISFGRILTGDAGVQRHNSARNICRMLFGNMQSTEEEAFNSVNQNEELQSSSGSVTVLNAKQSVFPSSQENGISGVLECKSICRLLFDHVKGEGDVTFDLVKENVKIHSTPLTATLPNARRFVLHSFKENMISGVSECKDICTVKFHNTKGKENEAFDSVVNHAKLYASSLILTVPNAKKYVFRSFKENRISGDHECKNTDTPMLMNCVNNESKEMLASSYKENLTPTTSLGKNLENSFIGFQRLSPNDLMLLNGRETPIYHMKDERVEAFASPYNKSVIQNFLTVLNGEVMLNDAHSSFVNQSGSCCVSITVYDRILGEMVNKRVKIIPFERLLNNTPTTDNNSFGGAHTSSGNQLECSSVNITMYDRSLQRLIRKRVKMIPFRCPLESSPSGNNNSLDDEQNLSADQLITMYDRSLRRLIRKRVKKIPFECLLENYQSGNNNALDDEHNLSDDQSEHSPITVNTSSSKKLESSYVSITVYDRNLRRLIRKRVKMISFQCLLEKSPSGNNNSFNDENNFSANQPEHSPVRGQSISEISVNMKTDKHAVLSSSDDYLTPEVSRDEEPKKHLLNRQERIEREKIKLGSERVQIQSSVNIFSRKNYPSYHAWQSSNKFADNSFGQSIGENSVNMNKEEQAAFSSSNDNLTPNATGVEMMPYKSFMETTFSRNSSSFYHACEASNNLAANSFSQHKDQLLTKAGEENRWNIVVDASCLLDKNSKRSLELLEGIKGTHLIIPKIVIRELDCMKRHEGWFSRTGKASSVLKWITKCMLRSSWWIQVQSSLEMTPTEPTSPASSLPQFRTGPSCSKAFSPLTEIVSPTIEDHILDCALLFKELKNDAQFVLLTNNVTLKIKAMAEGLVCEEPTEFCQSLLDPYSKRFLWATSRPKGYTLSRSDEQLIMTANCNRRFPVPIKLAKTAEGPKGLQLILPLSLLYEKTNLVM